MTITELIEQLKDLQDPNEPDLEVWMIGEELRVASETFKVYPVKELKRKSVIDTRNPENNKTAVCVYPERDE